ncbi:hypothetical protein RCL1_003613 [Eukaryota sp. TZLM3-RCL]
MISPTTSLHDHFISEHQTFCNRESLVLAVQNLAIATNKTFVLYNGNDSTRFGVSCSDDNCAFRIWAVSVPETSLFVVTKYVAHDRFCNAGTRPIASSSVIGSRLVEDLRRDGVISPTKLRKSMNSEVSYSKAWRAVEAAKQQLYGNVRDSYNLLPFWLQSLADRNPGSVVDIELTDNGLFRRCFFALEASKSGWKYCKPVIAIDGAFIKNKVLGVLLTSAAVDANGQLFPLGFGLVRSENKVDISWYLEHLINSFRIDDEVTVISDRGEALVSSINSVLPLNPHVYCVKHIADNLFGKGAAVAKSLVWDAAKSITERDYFNVLAIIKLKAGTCYETISKVDPSNIAEYAVKGRRFGHYTSNVVESLNSWINTERQLPVTQMFEQIRSKLNNWFVERREAASKLKTILTESAEVEMESRLLKSNKLRHTKINEGTFEVREEKRLFEVNILEKYCTCLQWQKEGMPCHHGLAVIQSVLRTRGKELCEGFHTVEYLQKTYAGTIRGVDDEFIETKAKEQLEMGNRVLAPEGNKRSGAPKIHRYRKSGEGGKNSKKVAIRPEVLQAREELEHLNQSENKEGEEVVDNDGKKDEQEVAEQEMAEEPRKRSYKCSNCGSCDHRKNKCPTPVAEQEKEKKRKYNCRRCGQHGHRANQCPGFSLE